ncbi:MAG: hypothetical protein L3J88_05840 [Gammaproteobacteria bacterium]|nr:hypothetical protein [Gammaproteobacteria bacterium]MCF6362857.1 hypothetical protein [Gammaproteobacteria bacterium]
MNGEIIIYESGNHTIEVRLDGAQETLWLTQKQLAALFGKDVRTVNEHLKNIYKEQELIQGATVRKFRIVQQEGKRSVAREIDH